MAAPTAMATCDTVQPGIPVNCVDCGTEMGMMVPRGPLVFLDTGKWLLRDGFCFCHRCGKPFHFKPPAAAWDELMARYQKRTASNGRYAPGQ